MVMNAVFIIINNLHKFYIIKFHKQWNGWIWVGVTNCFAETKLLGSTNNML